MFPNILLLQPQAARALLQYRVQTLGGALDNARSLGYQVREARAPTPQGPWEGRCRQTPLGVGEGHLGFLQGLSSMASLHCTGGNSLAATQRVPSLPVPGAATVETGPRRGGGGGRDGDGEWGDNTVAPGKWVLPSALCGCRLRVLGDM